MEVDTEDLEALAQMDTVYVNLTKREDRRKLIQGEMRAQGLKGRRFPAKTGDEVADSLVAREWHSGLNCLYDKKTVAALPRAHRGRGQGQPGGADVALEAQLPVRQEDRLGRAHDVEGRARLLRLAHRPLEAVREA